MVDSKEILHAFPGDVRKEIGHSLHVVQTGGTPENAKSLFSGAIEIRADSYTGNTYRAVYIAKLEDYVYVLHCFEKKSKKGIATPKPDKDLIQARLKAARGHNADYVKNRQATKR